MSIMNKVDKIKYQMLVGRVAKLRDKGYTVPEIAEKLKLDESQVRSLNAVVNEARANKARLEKDNETA